MKTGLHFGKQYLADIGLTTTIELQLLYRRNLQAFWISTLQLFILTFIPGSVLPPECPAGITTAADPDTKLGSVNLTHGSVPGELMLPAGLYTFKAAVEDRTCSVDVKVYGERL